VNVNQLSQFSANTLKQANDYTDAKFDDARRDGYGGAAAAIAIANLPQAVLPGRGMVAVGGGTYGGQSALAIGVSQLSENGIWAYKVTGTTSTRGQFGVGVGAGMHW
jgi:autotransporter adhesin